LRCGGGGESPGGEGEKKKGKRTFGGRGTVGQGGKGKARGHRSTNEGPIREKRRIYGTGIKREKGGQRGQWIQTRAHGGAQKEKVWPAWGGQKLKEEKKRENKKGGVREKRWALCGGGICRVLKAAGRGTKRTICSSEREKQKRGVAELGGKTKGHESHKRVSETRFQTKENRKGGRGGQNQPFGWEMKGNGNRITFFGPKGKFGKGKGET